MEAFSIYLFKSAGLLALFYACYRILLANETFFKSNRHFLLAGVLVSTLLPFFYLTKTVFVEALAINLTSAAVNFTQSTEPVASTFDWWLLISLIYGLGVLFFFCRFCIQLLSLKQLISGGKHIPKNGFIMVEVSDDTSPFSFFKYIVYNPKLHTEEKLNLILAHEKIHVEQKHSADMLLMHLLCIVQWFNPFSWWYKKASAQNLEFIADAEITKSQPCKKEYQYLLLNQSKKLEHSYSITNPFFNSLIKKRIVMINQKKSKRLHAFKYTLVLPFLALFLFLVNTKTVAQAKTDTETSTVAVEVYREINQNTTEKQLTEIETFFKELYYTDLSFHSVKRNNNDEITSIQSEYNNPALEKSGSWNINGKKAIKPFYFMVELDKDDHVIHVGYKNTTSLTKLTETDKLEIEKNAQEIVDNQPINATGSNKQITSQFLNGENAQKIVDTQPINATGPQHIMATRPDQKISLEPQAIDVSENGKYVRIRQGLGSNPLYIIDGIEQTRLNQFNLNPNDIEHVNVLKGEYAIIKYGDKAKNGVVEITTKQPSSAWSLGVKRADEKATGADMLEEAVQGHTQNQPLIVIDGEEKPAGYEVSMDSGAIESIAVLKDANATDKYGEKGKNGVVEIRTKEIAETTFKVHGVKVDGPEADSFIDILSFSDMAGKRPRVIVDGVDKGTDYNSIKIKYSELHEMYIEPAGAKKTIARYGEKIGKAGVIDIRTKKN